MEHSLKTILLSCALFAAPALCGGTPPARDSGASKAGPAAVEPGVDTDAGQQDKAGTKNALEHKVLAEGSGRKPKPDDTVTLHYRGRFSDGREFINTYERGRPDTLRVDQTMPAWREVLPRMQEGAKWELVVPPGLGYTRERGTAYSKRGLLTRREVVFELELVKVGGTAISVFADKFRGQRSERSDGRTHVRVWLANNLHAFSREHAISTQAAAFFEENALKERVVNLPGGLQYRVITQGHGASPGSGDTVSVHYRARWQDGTEFNNSYLNDKALVFDLDRLNPAWQEALQSMEQGSKWEFFVSPGTGFLVSTRQNYVPIIVELELQAVGKADRI